MTSPSLGFMLLLDCRGRRGRGEGGREREREGGREGGRERGREGEGGREGGMDDFYHKVLCEISITLY